jgi:alkylhydroperoxidase family enzyme
MSELSADPKYARKMEDLRRRLLEVPGALDQQVRRDASEGGPVPPALEAFVDKVRRHAYTVTDADVHDLLEAGYSQDQIFELTVVAAFGAAKERLHVGLEALAEVAETAHRPARETS